MDILAEGVFTAGAFTCTALAFTDFGAVFFATRVAAAFGVAFALTFALALGATVLAGFVAAALTFAAAGFLAAGLLATGLLAADFFGFGFVVMSGNSWCGRCAAARLRAACVMTTSMTCDAERNVSKSLL
jgi:hypothetical protein